MGRVRRDCGGRGNRVVGRGEEADAEGLERGAWKYTVHIATLVLICIALIAGLGYVRLLLKRKKRRAQRDQRAHVEQLELSDRMVDRLRDAFLWDKKSGKDTK